MKRAYLDTSVFFKIFFGETGKDIVDRIVLLAQEEKLQLVISEWVVNEAIASVEKKVSKGKITNSEAHLILVAIANFLEDNYPLGIIVSYAVNENVVLTSRAVIEYLRVNASDALHVLIASSSESNYFVSADRKLNDSILGGGLNIIPIYIYDKSGTKKFFSDLDNT